MTRPYAPIRVVDSTPALGLFVRRALPTGSQAKYEWKVQPWSIRLDTGRTVVVWGKIREGAEGAVLELTRETVSTALRRSASTRRPR